MENINKFELIKAVFDADGGYIDHKKILSTINRSKIINKIKKTYPEIKNYEKIHITELPLEEKNWSQINKKDKNRILKLYKKVKKSKNLDRVIKELVKFKKIYPNVPAIYNYLGIAYEMVNQTTNYYDILIETNKKFPDYIFGKISLAEYYLNHNQYNKIADILEDKFEITQHFPKEKNIYHVSEIRGFYYVTGRYFLNIGGIEMAYRSYFILSDIDVDHITSEILGQEIIAYELQKIKMANDKQKYPIPFR